MPYTYKIKVDLYNVFWPKMIVRLYYKEKLDGVGQFIELDEKQSHYLHNVLRLDIGSTFFVFDGKSGEYEAEIVGAKKKSVTVKLLKKTKELGKTPDYLVVQHMEPDHSANIVRFMDAYPAAVVVASQAAFRMMKQFYGSDYTDRRLAIITPSLSTS